MGVEDGVPVFACVHCERDDGEGICFVTDLVEIPLIRQLRICNEEAASQPTKRSFLRALQSSQVL